MKKNWMRQPPSFLLEEECHRNMAFSLLHADSLPLSMSVQTVEVKSLGDGVCEVTAIMENTKPVPTHSAADVRRKITPPDIATLSGAGLKQVHLALRSSEPYFRNPVEQQRNPSKLEIPSPWWT